MEHVEVQAMALHHPGEDGESICGVSAGASSAGVIMCELRVLHVVRRHTRTTLRLGRCCSKAFPLLNGAVTLGAVSWMIRTRRRRPPPGGCSPGPRSPFRVVGLASLVAALRQPDKGWLVLTNFAGRDAVGPNPTLTAESRSVRVRGPEGCLADPTHSGET
jgi:hypothetical protein